jgi:putative benzoate MFS transporter
MTELRVPLEGALQLALVLNAGGVIGSLSTGFVATRLGSLRTLGCAGLICAAMLILIPSGLVSGAGLMVLVTVAPTTQNLVNALVAEIVPAQSRAASLGRTLGVGRLGAITAPLIGSWLLAHIPRGSGLQGGAGSVFVTFAGVCLLGVAISLLFPWGARHARAQEITNEIG